MTANADPAIEDFFLNSYEQENGKDYFAEAEDFDYSYVRSF